tara:strand:+ start:1318 stop:1518 length:201 start_codon:yes stop_codon:yes gene_type:complete
MWAIRIYYKVNTPYLLLQKNLARGHEVDEIAEAVAVFGESGSDAIDFTAIEGFKAAASGVGEHFLS